MSVRRTFRKRADVVCYQRQLRDQYSKLGRPASLADVKLADGRVRPVTRQLAQQVILKYEWLGTMAQTSMHFGLFFGLHCAGVTCVGTFCHAGPQAHEMFGIGAAELLVLEAHIPVAVHKQVSIRTQRVRLC